MKDFRAFSVAFVAVALLGAVLAPAPAGAQAVTDQWSTVTMPTAPPVKAVTVDPKTTALVVMDFVKTRCTPQGRPRCAVDIPAIAKLIGEARGHGMFVVYTQIGNLTRDDFAAALAPLANEPVLLHTAVDKFYGTDLDQMLKDHGVKSVILTGTAANGAEIGTATAAALRGYKVIVPADGMPADTPFAEAFVAWNVVNGPILSDACTLTTIDQISF